MRRKAVPAR
jgi:hypothetical protein